MIIPEYQESVPTAGPEQETLAVQPRGAESSGENIAKSAEEIGKQVEAVGSQLTRHIVYMQKQKDSIDLQNRLLQVETVMQGGHAPLYARRGQQAFGVVSGSEVNSSLKPGDQGPVMSEAEQAKRNPDYIKFADSSAGIIERARKILMSGVDGKSPLPADIASQAESRFDNMAKSYSGRAVTHEAEQLQVAHIDSLNNSFAAAINSASMARGPKTFLPLVADAQKDAMEVARIKGQDINNKDTRAAIMQSAAKTATEKYLHANIDENPDMAQKVLNAAKHLMHPADAGDLQKSIDGKMMTVRDAQIWDNNIVPDKNLYNPDKTFKLGELEAEVRRIAIDRPESEIKHYVAQALARATTANHDIKQGYDEAEQQYLDGFSAAKSARPDANFVDVKAAADRAFQGKMPDNRLAKAGESAMRTWLGDPDGLGRRLAFVKANSNLNEGYQNAITQIDEHYVGSTPQIKEQKRLALQNLNNEVTSVDPQGKSRYTKGDQIAAWQADRFTNVKVPGAVFGNLWKANAVKGEEQTAAIQALGSRENLDAVWDKLKSSLGHAPSWSDVHEYIGKGKKLLESAPKEDTNVVP